MTDDVPRHTGERVAYTCSSMNRAAGVVVGHVAPKTNRRPYLSYRPVGGAPDKCCACSHHRSAGLVVDVSGHTVYYRSLSVFVDRIASGVEQFRRAAETRANIVGRWRAAAHGYAGFEFDAGASPTGGPCQDLHRGAIADRNDDARLRYGFERRTRGRAHPSVIGPVTSRHRHDAAKP